MNLWTVTGGRPMTRISHRFVDRVSLEDVCHYRDKLGRDWLATSAWALFRVPLQHAQVAWRALSNQGNGGAK